MSPIQYLTMMKILRRYENIGLKSIFFKSFQTNSVIHIHRRSVATQFIEVH